MSLISFKENNISQRPALELLQALGSLIIDKRKNMYQ